MLGQPQRRLLSLKRMYKEKGEQRGLGLVWVLFGVHGKEAWSSILCEEGMTYTFKMGFLGSMLRKTIWKRSYKQKPRQGEPWALT